MSHFLVLVIGADPEKQLAPYHEFECTGEDNEYVVNVFQTDEARKEYEESTSSVVVDPEGNVYGAYDSRFYVETQGRHGIKRTRVIPDGWVENEVKTKERETFLEFVKGYYAYETVDENETPDLANTHKYGYIRVNAAGDVLEVVRRTNPNKKWDWYALGGRWTGFFKLKHGTAGVTGRPGLFTEAAEEGRADAAIKSDIDIEGMRDEAERKARAKHIEFHAIVDGLAKPRSWEEIREEYKDNINQARDVYHSQEAIQALSKYSEFMWLDDPMEYYVTEDEYAKTAREGALVTFALLKDGQWYERGDMGWWGCVSDEKDKNEWQRQFSSLIDSVPDNTPISVYDCHI